MPILFYSVSFSLFFSPMVVLIVVSYYHTCVSVFVFLSHRLAFVARSLPLFFFIDPLDFPPILFSSVCVCVCVCVLS